MSLRQSAKPQLVAPTLGSPFKLMGDDMNLTVSLAVLAASIVLLFFGRGRGGDALPMFRNWVVGMLFSIGLLYLFAAGLGGVLVNMNWLH